MRLSHRLVVGFVALSVVFGCGSAAALAKGKGITRGANGALHGCINHSGVLKVVAVAAKCPHGQTSITFGANGANGSAGKDGSAGSDNAAQVQTLTSEVTALQSQVQTLTTQLTTLKNTFSGVSRANNTLLFSGMNLQVESGAGSTTATPNGLGNVIIGYNENPGSQTGSANLVLGNGQAFTSYGGVVAGQGNTVSAPFAATLAGTLNVASDSFAAVLGGCGNLAGPGTVSLSAVCSAGSEGMLGGAHNHDSGLVGVASGGIANVVSGGGASVSGGINNQATVTYSSVTGGELNTASGSASSVTGGYSDVASGTLSVVLGGNTRSATGNYGLTAGTTQFTP